MTNDFHKFPSTPHLTLLGDIDVRSDKLMSDLERDAFLRTELIVEEKIDGANLGISIDDDGNVRAQNRGGYLDLPAGGQWKKLKAWLDERTDLLFEILSNRYILFGEWCYAQHSVYYDQLPDWFFGFDIFDKNEERFFSTARRDDFFSRMNIYQNPRIAAGHFSLTKLKALLSTSQYSNEPAEGLYLRHDQGEWLAGRAKLVRPAFVQSQEQHWLRSGIRPNRLKSDFRNVVL
jgi:ATP-dependent RNA circularization protein (DNA/RNA ligase family)